MAISMRAIGAFLVASAAAILLATSAGAQEGDHQAMVEEAHQRYEQLTAEGEYEALAEMFTPDGLYMPADGEMLEGRDEIRSYMEEHQFAVKDIESTRIDPVGDVVIDIGSFVATFPEESGRGEMPGEYVAVTERTDDRLAIRSLIAFPPREADMSQ